MGKESAAGRDFLGVTFRPDKESEKMSFNGFGALCLLLFVFEEESRSSGQEDARRKVAHCPTRTHGQKGRREDTADRR